MATIHHPLTPKLVAYAPRSWGKIDEHGWGFISLLLVVGVLFLRPADLIPALDDWPIYQVIIIASLILSARAIWVQLAERQIGEQPVTGCLLLLLVGVAGSHLANGFVWGARSFSWEYAKFLALYLLMVGLINSPQRLVMFVRWLTLAITLMASLSLMDQYEWISLTNVSAVKDSFVTAEEGTKELARIRGTGIFADPNDLGLVVVTGIVFSLYFVMTSKIGWPKYFWLIPTIILYLTLVQTHSRGAFLSLAAVIPAWFFYRNGWRFAVAGSALVVPMMLLVFAGRMTQVNSVVSGTGQSRIQLWSDSLAVFRESPLFGIGAGMYPEQYGVASHNSFLQCFVELGLIGGVVFLAAFLVAIVGLVPRRAERMSKEKFPAEILLRGYVFAALVGYTIGILTLSRQFVGPTYLMLGLAAATQTVTRNPLSPGWKLSVEFGLRALLASALFLIGVYVAIRVLVRW